MGQEADITDIDDNLEPDADEAGADDGSNPSEDDGVEAADPGADDGQGDGEDADAELVVTIGDDDGEDPLLTDAPDDSSVIKQLRARVRESAPAIRARERENKQLKEEIERLKGTAGQPAAIVVGDKPTLEGCDWDADKFSSELEAWHVRKGQAEEQQRKQQQAQEQEVAKWNKRIADVNTSASSIKVPDQDTAQQAFEDNFELVQRGIVIGGPEDPKDAALLRYALGKNPGIAKKLADIKDPVRFAFAAAKILYKDLNVKPRNKPPTPETVVKSSVSGAAAVDTQLKRLQDEADKTGDRSKVAAYLRNKNKARQAA